MVVFHTRKVFRMQIFGLMIPQEDREADIIEQAVSDVLLADVISQETKNRLVDCLNLLKTGLSCPDAGCTGCCQRKMCERLVDGVLSTT